MALVENMWISTSAVLGMWGCYSVWCQSIPKICLVGLQTAAQNPTKSGQKSGRSRIWPNLSKRAGCRTCRSRNPVHPYSLYCSI